MNDFIQFCCNIFDQFKRIIPRVAQPHILYVNKYNFLIKNILSPLILKSELLKIKFKVLLAYQMPLVNILTTYWTEK